MSDCSICYDPLPSIQLQKTLGCGHAYHPACINEWFTTSDQGACPTCRVVEPGFVRPLQQERQERQERQPYRIAGCYKICFYLAAFVYFLVNIIFHVLVMAMLVFAVLNPVGLLYLLYLSIMTLI